MGNTRTAVVTGGSRGIGKAIATALAADGVATVIADIDGEAARATAAELTGAVASVGLDVDMGDRESIAALFRQVEDLCGGVDILVNNAGILSTASIEEIAKPELARVLAIDLEGPIFAVQEALKSMPSDGTGRIVNIASDAGRAGGVGSGIAYVAAKASLIGVTRYLANRLADRGLTVNAVAPGPINTDIMKGFSPEQFQAMRESIPLGRMGEPSEIGATVAFLASPQAGFITGAVIDVNGGKFMG